MQADLEKLQGWAGSFGGHGINHDEEPFYGELSLTPVVDGRGVRIEYVATGIEGTEYHRESSTLACDPSGKLALWVLHSNAPGMLQHAQRFGASTQGAHTLVFAYGAAGDPFVEEIAIDLWPDESVSYRYSWGLPDDPMRERSSVRMKRLS